MNVLPGFDEVGVVEKTEPKLSPYRASKGKGPSYGARLTARKNDMLANGRNPGSGHELAHTGETCGTCIHARTREDGRAKYWKCELGQLSHGPATDIRLKWPACVRWKTRP